MRLVKFTVLRISVAVVGVLVYAFWLGPRLWPSLQRREAIRLLSTAQTPKELTSAVGRWGAFITLTNAEWLAIRYRDSHSPEVQSMAVARDSGNQWFESQRHFCGVLSYLSRDLQNELEMRKFMPDAFTNRDGSSISPKIDELIPLFTAADLTAARRQLLALGFKQIQP